MIKLLLIFTLFSGCTWSKPEYKFPPEARRKTPPKELQSAALKVGAQAPQVVLASTAGEWSSQSKDPIVYVFYRGSWCPYCRKQLVLLQEHHKEFTDLKATIVGVSVDTVEASKILADDNNLKFPLLSDPQGVMVKKFGLWDAGNEIAWPAVYVMKGGKVIWRDLSETYTVRPLPQVILEQLK
jgi:peroxiredoxin